MLSTGEEIRSPQRSSRSGPILAKMPCTRRLQQLASFDSFGGKRSNDLSSSR